MRATGKYLHILLAVLALGLLAGCSGIFGHSGSSEPSYYAEFEDIPIPSELGGIKETTIITTPGGVKTGLQVFKGRVEVGSLNSAMVGYLQREGWELRSSTRGSRSLLLFEKQDRYCTIYILDGFFYTEMQVYVSPKLGKLGGVSSPEVRKPVEPKTQRPAAAKPSAGFESQTLSE